MLFSLKFIFAYILGGITLIPCLIILAYSIYFIHSRIIYPTFIFFHSNYEITNDNDLLVIENDDTTSSKLLYKVGWLKVSREDGETPPDATIGDMVKNYISGLANNNKKEHANTYFSVLKYNTLYLYDSEKQLDCKGVINLSNFNVKMFPPGLQDYELYSKPHLIHLQSSNELNHYINCSKCIDKEDWYFAFIRASKFTTTTNEHTDNTRFDQSAMNHLIKMVYSDEHHFETQWFNALLGRIFFGIYRTQDIKDAVYKKVITKLDKINAKRPPFLGEITVRSADPGQSLPRFTQPKLLGLSPTGELSAEVMLQYDGGFRLEIETVLKWKYSDLLKPLTIDLVLGIMLKEISGKLLIKIKEPPTNRFWYAFYECPKMEWKVEPLVWEKRVGYSVVVKAIETKIQEFIMETMVLPHFDDITFLQTNGVGGIFETPPFSPPLPASSPILPPPVKETATLILDAKKIKKDRQKEDQALLTTARSLPELISAVPNNKLLAQRSNENLIPTQSAPVLIDHLLSSPAGSYNLDTPITKESPSNTIISPILLPTATEQVKMANNEILSTSFEDTYLLSTSPATVIFHEPFRNPKVTDDIVTPCDSQESNSSISSNEFENDNKIRLRKSSSIAILKTKTVASTAVNVSPAMAHKKEKKDAEPISALTI